MTSSMKGYGLGRRKTAVARARLTDVPEVKQVNGQALEEYFVTESMRTAVMRPLKVTSQVDEVGIELRVEGGGKQSQAEAATLAVARALLAIDEGYRKQLRAGGYLTRDSRMKERKKPGLKRARRAPQFSKR